MNLSSKAKKSLDEVLEKFREGDLPEKIAETVIEGEGKPSHNWSLLNKIIMLANETSDARGYKQWQKVDRHVKKGSKAFHIIGPTLVTEEKEVKNEDGEMKIEKEKKLVGFHSVPVFRHEDTEGELLPDYTPKELPPLNEIIEKLDYDLEYSAYNGIRGYTVPEDKKIALTTEDQRTFYHELAHAVHHKISTNGLRPGQQSNQEVIAESVAAVLCNLYGFDKFLAKSYNYIEAYSENGDPYRAVMGYLSDVEEVLDYLLKLTKEEKKYG